MDIEPLRKIGLTEGEIKIYLALLENGRSPVAFLAMKTKLNRTGLYDIIEGLIEKGLVSFIFEEKKKYYQATKPGRILEYLEEKKEDLTKEEEFLKKLVAVLNEIKPKKEEGFGVEIYRGKKGIKSVLEDVLQECKKGEEVIAFGLGGSNFEALLGSYYHHYIFRHINDYGIKFRAIFDESEKEQPYVKELGKIPLTKAKFIFKNYNLPTHTRVYGSKVAIIILEKDPVAILIDNQKVAKGYRYFFEFLWNLV